MRIDTQAGGESVPTTHLVAYQAQATKHILSKNKHQFRIEKTVR